MAASAISGALAWTEGQKQVNGNIHSILFQGKIRGLQLYENLRSRLPQNHLVSPQKNTTPVVRH
jgi:hypothetical protein